MVMTENIDDPFIPAYFEPGTHVTVRDQHGEVGDTFTIQGTPPDGTTRELEITCTPGTGYADIRRWLGGPRLRGNLWDTNPHLPKRRFILDDFRPIETPEGTWRMVGYVTSPEKAHRTARLRQISCVAVNTDRPPTPVESDK